MASYYTKPPWAQEPQHEWTLTEIKGGVEQSVHKLSTSACTVLGRAADQVDIALQHESASRQHARIAFDRTGTPWLRDLQSTHGTSVNKKRLPAAAIGRSESNSTKAGARGVVLYPGDVLQFGASTRIYCVEGPAEFARGAIRKVDIVPKTTSSGSDVQLPAVANQEAEGQDLSEGVTWGIDMDDPGDERTGDIPSDLLDDDKIPEKHQKEWERLKALRYKLQNIQSESERIRFKASSTELSAGQERQLERNDERIANLQEQIREKESELYHKVYPDRGCGHQSSMRAAREGDGAEEDVDDFYDRTKEDKSNQLELDRNGETEESLIAKWKGLRQQRLAAITEFGQRKQKVVELEQRVAYLNAKGDEESFFAQNDLDLAKESMQTIESKMENLEKKMAEAEELLKIANADLTPNRETGHIHRKGEVLPGSKDDDRIKPPGPSVDETNRTSPGPPVDDRIEKQIVMPVDEVVTTEHEVILPLPPPASVETAGSGSGNFIMPPPSKKRQRVVGPAMMPPPSAVDKILPPPSRSDAKKKKAEHSSIGTLAALSSMASGKASKLGSTRSSNEHETKKSTAASAAINVNEKEDVWQVPKDQDGSGITKLNAKFAGRY